MMQKYISRHQKDIIYISVNKALVYIPAWTYEKMEKPQRLEVMFDKETNEIKLQYSSIGIKVSDYKKGFVALPIRLSNFMPLGKYFYALADQSDNSFRFKRI